MSKIKSPKKLIEVALPLDDINAACAYEKMPGIGPHPRGIHLWWARRPLAAARAFIFAQMVNDPSETVSGDKRLRETKLKIQNEREKLFDIIRELVKWENTNNEVVLNKAREAIKESWRFTCELNTKHPQAKELFNPDELPAFHDPFAGGGAIPLEAQRLGLKSYASDLNPVAVMLNKAMIEFPPKFHNKPPVGPMLKSENQNQLLGDWHGITGLAEDVRRYGYWMHDAATKIIGDYYPEVFISDEMIDERPDLEQYRGVALPVIAWLWARTVKSPSPAFKNSETPLVKSFILSKKKSKKHYLQPSVDGGSFKFKVLRGEPPKEADNGTKASGRGANFNCIYTNSPITGDYIKEQGKKGEIGFKLTAVVLEGKKERVYISPTPEIENSISVPEPDWKPTGKIPSRLTGGTCVPYGYTEWGDIFTKEGLHNLPPL